MTNWLYKQARLLTLLVAGATFSCWSSADQATVLSHLLKARPGIEIESITPSVATGMFEVRLDDGTIIYVTSDGEHFVLGDLFSVGDSGFVNIAEQRRDELRRQLIASVKIEDMIVFSPAGEKKAHVNVFTDVDCFYCQKLHKEVPALNALGVEVRYLAYPRSGIGAESYRKIASAWCSSDPNKAMNSLKKLEQIPINVCLDNPVAEHFMLGQKVGVRGTPAMVLEDGQLVQGYMPADKLAAQLGIN